MKYLRPALAALALSVSLGSYIALAQQPQQPPPPMNFFVTSVAKGDGANYGGLAGADAHCQMLAQAAGRGGVEVGRLPEHPGYRRRQRTRPDWKRSLVQLPRRHDRGQSSRAAR